MNRGLKISETIENIETASNPFIKAQIKITNTSNSYINNLKLIINSNELAILEPCIIRQRGALLLDAINEQLDIGNLAPEETAYFEYAYSPSQNTCSLLKQLAVRYTPEYSSSEIYETIAEFLSEVSEDKA